MASIYLQKQDPKSARTHARSALAYNHKNIEALLTSAKAAMMLGRNFYTEAREALERAYELSPSDSIEELLENIDEQIDTTLTPFDEYITAFSKKIWVTIPSTNVTYYRTIVCLHNSNLITNDGSIRLRSYTI